MQVIVGAGKYIREEKLLNQAGRYMKVFGKKAVYIGGKTALSVVAETLKSSFAKEGITIEELLWYGGEASQTNIDRLVEVIQALDIDLIIVVGGGKAIDTGKAVAYALNKPLVAIPTIAATCAATTPISVLYDDEGTFTEVCHASKAPDLVFVDTEIIANAPGRLLAAGIGDTLAKWFESKTSVQKAQPTALNRSAVALAKQLYTILLESGDEAMASVRKQQVAPALNDIVDAVILVSGSVSGYGGTDCRTAAAHAIYSGLTIFPQVHHTYHGEIVAFGILAQLVMEGKEAEAEELLSFYQAVGLPKTLNEMGIKQLSEAEWQRFGEVTVKIEDMANMPFAVTPAMVVDAVKSADAIGSHFLRSLQV